MLLKNNITKKYLIEIEEGTFIHSRFVGGWGSVKSLMYGVYLEILPFCECCKENMGKYPVNFTVSTLIN